jgi:hypothetical protein
MRMVSDSVLVLGSFLPFFSFFFATFESLQKEIGPVEGHFRKEHAWAW